MSAPAISIVVPCYNSGRFVSGLLETLKAQLFQDFEIIIVDDGSEEPETLAILETLPDTVRLIRQENRGLSGARNTGFRVARAPFVLPLDCDDRLMPEFLSEAFRMLSASGPATAFVFTHMQVMGVVEGTLPRQCNLFDQLFRNQLPYCMLMRKSAWARVGGYDETFRLGYEDWDFNLRLLKAGFSGLEIPRPLFIYRVSPAGMLMSRSAWQHGLLWRMIRAKHPADYRLSALMKLWNAHSRRGRVGIIEASLMLLAAKTLPDSVFGYLFHGLIRTSHRLRLQPSRQDRPVETPQPHPSIVPQG